MARSQENFRIVFMSWDVITHKDPHAQKHVPAPILQRTFDTQTKEIGNESDTYRFRSGRGVLTSQHTTCELPRPNY